MLTSDIVRYAARRFSLSEEQLLKDRRAKPIYRARAALYAAMWLRAELAGKQPTYAGIGRAIGGRDHTTIMHGMKRAQDFMETDQAFVEAVVTIATVTMADIEEEACNPPLHAVRVRHQQRQERPVTHPETTEAEINAALDKAGLKKVRVYWDGNIVTREDPATFDVYYNEDDTDTFVTDDVHAFELIEICADRVRRSLGEARDYDALVDHIADFIKNYQIVEAA